MKKFTKIACLLLLVSQIAAQNVRMIKDLNPGKSDGLPYSHEQAALFASLDTVLIFLALGESNARILCRTDAKNISTIPLLPPFTDQQKMGDWVVSGGLFWFAFDNDGTAELYSTDGSLPGTKKRYSQPTAGFSKLRAFKNGVVFHEQLGNSDDYLTRFLPTDAAAVRISQFNSFGGIVDLTTDATQIYGIGASFNGNSDRYIFTSTGDAGNLQSKVLFHTGNEFNTRCYLTVAGSKLFFFFQKNGDERKLWVSDLTAAGTIALKNMDIEEANLPYPQRVVVVFNGKFVFRGKSSDNASIGNELWMSDGTIAGTVLLKDVANGSDDSSPRYFTEFKGLLYFTADNFVGSPELWQTNLTTAGTKRVIPIFEYNNPHGRDLCIFRDSLAFGAHRIGIKPGQVMLSSGLNNYKIIQTPNLVNEFAFEPDNLVAAGHLLYFAAATAATGRELWVYNPKEKTVVATKSPENQQVLKISPNPADQFVQLDLPDAATGRLQVFAADGRQIFQKEVFGKEKLEVAAWQTGNYFLIFSDGKNRWMGSFQKL